MRKIFAEWEAQECLIFALPHEKTDWAYCLDEILNSYYDFIKTVSKFQKCLVICKDKIKAKELLHDVENIELVEILTDDTWIRDFGPIDVKNDKIISYDFTFNAWGGKFNSSLDDMVNQTLFENNHLNGNLESVSMVLEGGSIDANGDGVLLTTTKCLLEENRNPLLDKQAIDEKLKELFGLRNVIWLENGFLKGDDTDSHVDTLARFINKNTIVYSICEDEDDEHYSELKKMENELKKTGFNLISLPIPKPIFYNNHRLPATYANFVFVNGAIIVPIYHDENDEKILNIFKDNLPNHQVIGVDATIFIREHGSLHCASMNRYFGYR